MVCLLFYLTPIFESVFVILFYLIACSYHGFHTYILEVKKDYFTKLLNLKVSRVHFSLNFHFFQLPHFTTFVHLRGFNSFVQA